MSRKYLLPTKLYKDITSTLYNAKVLTEIPDLKWTTNTSVFGYLKTVRVTNKYTGIRTIKRSIYLNKGECPCLQIDFRVNRDKSVLGFFELIDTICHELAHIEYRGHNNDHKNLTEEYKRLILTKYQFNYSYKYIREYISDIKVK